MLHRTAAYEQFCVCVPSYEDGCNCPCCLADLRHTLSYLGSQCHHQLLCWHSTAVFAFCSAHLFSLKWSLIGGLLWVGSPGARWGGSRGWKHNMTETHSLSCELAKMQKVCVDRKTAFRGSAAWSGKIVPELTGNLKTNLRRKRWQVVSYLTFFSLSNAQSEPRMLCILFHPAIIPLRVGRWQWHKHIQPDNWGMNIRGLACYQKRLKTCFPWHFTVTFLTCQLGMVWFSVIVFPTCLSLLWFYWEQVVSFETIFFLQS